jgi:acetyltransferase
MLSQSSAIRYPAPMPILRPPRNRFDPERLYRPQSLVVLGAGRLADLVLANIRAGGFPGDVQTTDDPAQVKTADLAILTGQGPPIGAILPALAAKGIYAAIALGLAPDIVQASAATGVKVLGAGSFGVAVPALKLNATLSHLVPRPGRVALVSQSAALCRAVLDWAEPNGVGFSQIVGIGGNAGVGFAQTLDFLSRDPAVGPVLLDIRRVRDRRAFLSAARAAARLRPVIAIRAGSRLIDPSGQAEAVFDAALNRAGVLTVQRLEDLLAAAETLTRAPPARGEGIVIVTNAIGLGQMAADAALSAGITLAPLAPETREVLRLAFPSGDAREIVYVGVEAPTRIAEAAALLAGAREVGGILAVFAPTGLGDAAGIAALAATPRGKTPLLVCAMGETTGAGHRRALAAAGIPAFASPEQAVQGFRHLLMDRRARAAARELPSSTVLSLAPDRAAIATLFAAARTAGRLALTPAEARAAFAIYGVPGSPSLRIAVADDALFGPAISLGHGRIEERAFDLPPLNLPLAHSLIQHARDSRSLPSAQQDTLADALVRTSQLVIDFPEIAALAVGPAQEGGPHAELTLRPAGDASPLAIAPYPAELTETWAGRSESFTIRPVRPEDSEAHHGLFTRLSPEDIRYRFFSMLRELSAERIVRMTQVDYDREMAFIAVRANGDTVGVARLVCDAQGGGEFAVVIQPDAKGQGVARRLMERLAEWGRAKHLTSMTGQVLADNQPMLAFMRKLGFTLHRMADDPEVMEAVLVLRQDA